MGNMAITVTLSVTPNSLGKGNTRDGRYDYKFDPDVVHVTDQMTAITYQLDDTSGYEMVDLYTTDVQNQLSKPILSHDRTKITVIHQNTTKQLTVVSVRVKDRALGTAVCCDPQVTNDPPPVSTGH